MESQWDGAVTVSLGQSCCRKHANGIRTTRSDWLAWETARDPLEVAIPAF
jgi:hypothetical protein